MTRAGFRNTKAATPATTRSPSACSRRFRSSRRSPEVKAALEKAILSPATSSTRMAPSAANTPAATPTTFSPTASRSPAKWMPEALAINDRFLTGLAAGLGSCYADDHIIGHHTWSYLLAYQHWASERPEPKPRPGWPPPLSQRRPHRRSPRPAPSCISR